MLKDTYSLLGVTDPTGKLEENQIFVQINKKTKNIDEKQYQIIYDQGQSKIITGTVVVTKSPSVHPGDIQLFECVDIPELRCLSNVVVFSNKGEGRPACNKMSCGDLDGDVYFVSSNKDLLD